MAIKKGSSNEQKTFYQDHKTEHSRECTFVQTVETGFQHKKNSNRKRVETQI